MRDQTTTPKATRVIRHILAIGGSCLLAFGPLRAPAQTGLSPAAPSVDPAASASTAPTSAAATRPTPQVTGPSDARRSLDLNNPQPEGKVTPQLRIPLGKKGDATSSPVVQRGRSSNATPLSSASRIDDGAARCGAEASADLRAKCRSDLARSAGKP